ncbi:MAG: hypothetical protein EAS52_13245 [Parapedobacter sp.]|nr:MAG: hypothetical protein EAS52_13245 [Parapedobacter sp.]
MKLAPPSFKSQDKYSQTNAYTQASPKSAATAVKHLTASLCLRILETHYGLSVIELTQTYPNRINDVCTALQRLTEGWNNRGIKDSATMLLRELQGQSPKQ